MPDRVAVVTDSTGSLPDDALVAHHVSVVPLHVVMGGRSYVEGVGVPSAAVAEALRRHVAVSTSRPTAEEFLAAYQAAAARGAAAVVSVHLSAAMSGTCDSALLAARAAPLPVHVVDSRLLGMGLGFAVLDAARAAASGGSAEQVVTVARQRAAATSVLFYVDTLEHLRRGGRIGAAQALIGSALAVKPLLALSAGSIVALEKVRTASRAIARLEEIAAERAGSGEVDLAVQHLANPDRARTLAEHLRRRLPQVATLRVCEVGAVVGAHVGPGLLAVVVARR